jgi:hypothetical protein
VTRDRSIERHFVTFLSPGTFVAEQTTREIDAWDVDHAVEMSKSVTERHGARPYGFYFTTRGRGPDDLDSKEVGRSRTYYLGGEVLTLDEIRDKNDTSDLILISNMESGGYDRVVVTPKPWGWTRPLMEDDVVLQIEE